MSKNRSTFLILAAVALALAVLRFFLRGLVEPWGVPAWAGSLLASLWLLLGLALLLFFIREGRAPHGRYWRAAGWFLALAAWCELLVIAGVLLSDAVGWPTYYDGPFQAVRQNFPTASRHAVGHVQGFFPRAAIWLALGAAAYFIAKRGRKQWWTRIGAF